MPVRTPSTRLVMPLAVLVAALTSSATADSLNWAWVDLESLPPRGPMGSPTNGPENISDGTAPVNPLVDEFFYYMVDAGENADGNGGDPSHWDVEGVDNGTFAGGAWLRWTGLLSGLKADADAAFGVDTWTIRRLWVSVDEASFSFGDTGGCVAFAEVNNLLLVGALADWGDPASGCTQTALAGGIPRGYAGHAATATAGAPTNQSWLVYDGTSGPALPRAGGPLFRRLHRR